MAVEVQWNQNELSANSRTILMASTGSEAQAAQDSYKIIVSTAQELISKYQLMLTQLANFENALKHAIKSWHTFKASCQKNGMEYKGTAEYDEYIRSRKRIRQQNFSAQIQANILETYEYAMTFQEYLNAALGQEVSTAYVWVSSKGVPETYVIHDMSDFLKVDVDRYGNVVVRYRNNAKMLRQHAQKIESMVQDNPEFNYAALRSTYQTAASRFNSHKKSGGGAFVLWLNPYGGQKWHGVLVSSFGSINEAYSTLLLHEHFNPTDALEDNMEQFMAAVMGVTNLSGTLEGDTTVGQMEVAVKSNQATTLSIEQLYNMAQDIVNQKLNNFNAIQSYLVKKKQANKQAERAINVSLQDVLQGIADDAMEDAVQSVMRS